MKMVKSLLLGSAAGIAAFGGAQAADLPVKAKPVEYVKVCSLYGAGFWYVPGTDTCLKIGSYIRTQSEFNAGGGGITSGIGDNGSGGHFDRTDTSQYSFRSRGALSVDLRTQTEYGTLRSYIEVGGQVSTASNSAAGSNASTADAIFIDRAFVQFAGFTVGRYRSFFDINSFAPYNYSNSRVSPDSGATGIYGLAYTAQLGNGFTATVAVEDPGLGAASGRGKVVFNTNNVFFQNGVQAGTAPLTVNAGTGAFATATDNAGVTYPDLVGALRVDQAWGYAQVSAALHDASGGYYAGAAPLGLPGSSNLQTSGHPGNAVGWAVSAGFTLKDVGGLKGDSLGLQYTYSEGAAGYAAKNINSSLAFGSGNSLGVGLISDGVYGTVNGVGSSVELTTAWSLGGFYEHLWTPKWKTSVYGGIADYSYTDTARQLICNNIAGGLFGASGAAAGGFSPTTSNCSPDNSTLQAGTRTQWNPHPDLDIGVDFLYTKLYTAFKGNTALTASTGARPAGNYSIDDQDVYTVMFRVQRNFLP